MSIFHPLHPLVVNEHLLPLFADENLHSLVSDEHHHPMNIFSPLVADEHLAD